MDYIIIDNRMRNIEKNMLKYLGYKLVEIQKSNNVYAEISSHVDIFTTKIDDTLIVEKSKYEDLEFSLKDTKYNIISGIFVEIFGFVLCFFADMILFKSVFHFTVFTVIEKRSQYIARYSEETLKKRSVF